MRSRGVARLELAVRIGALAEVAGGAAFAAAGVVTVAAVVVGAGCCGCGWGAGDAAAGGGGAGTVGVGTVGVGTVGVGTVGVGTVGAGTVGSGTVGSGSVGSGGRGGSSSARAETAKAAAATVARTPQIRRTPGQRRRGRIGYGCWGVVFAAMRFSQDYYDVLGVPRDASGDEIKRAFRALVRRLHPDVATQPVDESFHDVVAAYEVLSHPRKRSLYDRLRNRRSPVARPAPAVPPLELSLAWYEAERGVARQVQFEEVAGCIGCGGRGVPQGVTAAECVSCRGSGRLSKVTESKTIRLLEFNYCGACRGTGHAAAPSCLDCGGGGTTSSVRSLRVRVPAGVRDGDLIQVDGVDRRFRLTVAARPRDSSGVLLLAGLALACAVGLLLFLLLR